MDYSMMKKVRLIEEIEALQGKIAELERTEAQRKRAEEEIKQRNRELAALNAIANVMSQSLNLDEILNAALDKVLELIHLDVGGIYLADPARRKLDLVVHRGISKEFIHEIESVSVDEKTLEAAMAEGKLGRFILSVKAVMKDRVELKRIVSAMKKEGLSLASGVPVLLQAKEEIVGLMIVASCGPRQYSEAEQGLLTSIGQQIAVAIQNARLYEAVRQDLAERKRAEERIEHLNLVLRAIRKVNQLITREKDRAPLLQGVCESLIETRGYDNAWIALLDASRKLMTTAEAGLGKDFLPMVERLKRGELTTCGRRALTQPGVVITDDPPSACADCPLSKNYGGREALTVRLEHGGKVYGLLSASIPAYLTADEEEQILFEQVAADIAFALHSIELEEERVRAEEALELKVEQLAALSQASQVVTASLELDQVLAEIVSLAGEVVSTDYTSVVLVDAAGNIGRSAENLPGVPDIEYRIRDKGLTRWIVHSRQAGVIDEIGEDGAMIPDLGEGAPRFANPPIVEAGVKSVAGLPLMVKDRLLGVLYLHSLRAGAFHGQLPLLTTFANQLAIAVDNARLYEALKQELAERKRAEQALRESEERYRLLFERNLAGVYTTTLDGDILDCNEAFAQIFGYDSREELLAHEAWELYFDTADREEFIAQLRQEGALLGREWLLRRKDGIPVWVLENSNPIEGEEGRLAFVQGTLIDITERKRAEEELIRLSNAVNMSTDSIVISDLEAIIIDVNEATLRMYGTDNRRDLIGRSSFDLVAPEDRERAFAGMQEALGKGYVKSREYRIITKDGSRIPVEMSAALLKDAAGEPIGFVGVSRDITERVRAERLLRALDHAAVAVGKALTPEEMFTTVAEEFKKLGFSCAVLLMDESQKRLLPKYFSYRAGTIKAAEKLVGLKAENLSIPVETVDVYRKVVRERKTVFVQDAEEVVRQLLPGPVKRLARQIAKMLEATKSIDAPLIVEDEIIGLLLVQSDDLTKDDIPAITAFAHQMAAAWRKATLLQDLERSLIERERAQEELRQSYMKLQKALEGTINTLVSAIEIRDPYTAGHQRRVTQLACAIANEMGLPKEQIQRLRMAGLIHDVGKISVPAEILSKPGPLSDLEYGLIQAHTQVGYDILDGAVEFPWPVAQIVLQHHERMDGSGYPQGLSGEEIMLEARILGVVDVVEAMSSYRPYRPPRGLDKALEEISQNRDVLYDPEVVDACLKLFTEKGFEFE